LPVEILNRFKAETGIPVLEGYGLTEGTCVSAVNPRRGEQRPGSVGLRLPYQEMKVARIDDGVYRGDCAPGEIGTILVRGPNVFRGYKEADHNRDVWVEAGDGDPWLNTGDLGRQDEDGYFWIEGRKKDLIIRGGHNIDPSMIEEPLHEHPAVEIAAAVGRPDAYAGELPVAYVQLRAGATATEEELLDYAQQCIKEQAAVPKRLHILDEMPQTAVGKIFKPALRRRETADVYRTAAQQTDGVAHADVATTTGPDDELHLRLRVEIEPSRDPEQVRTRVEEALGHYTPPYTLTIAS
jgi:fatty-acyl-CoA synthase